MAKTVGILRVMTPEMFSHCPVQMCPPAPGHVYADTLTETFFWIAHMVNESLVTAQTE